MLTSRVHEGFVAAVSDPVWAELALVAAADETVGPWIGSPQVRRVDLADFAADLDRLDVERFGPAGLVVVYPDVAELPAVLAKLAGSLTATIHADADDPGELAQAGELAAVLGRGRRAVDHEWLADRRGCVLGDAPRRTLARHHVGGPHLSRRRRPCAAGWCRSPTRTGPTSCCRRRCRPPTRWDCAQLIQPGA